MEGTSAGRVCAIEGDGERLVSSRINRSFHTVHDRLCRAIYAAEMRGLGETATLARAHEVAE